MYSLTYEFFSLWLKDTIEDDIYGFILLYNRVDQQLALPVSLTRLFLLFGPALPH